MKGQNVGYIRVSSQGQNGDRQLEGMFLDKVFTEKVSGKNTNRAQLKEMINYIREGDIVYVHSLDRLGRSLIDLQTIVDDITNKGCEIHFVKENLSFTQEYQNPMNTLLFHILSSFAEFERKIIKQRQREGIDKALEKGVRFGRINKLSKKEIEELIEMMEKGVKRKEICRHFSITKQTLYNYYRKYTQ